METILAPLASSNRSFATCRWCVRVLTPAVKKFTGLRLRGSEASLFAEHVPDIEVFTVDHHLDAIGASALIAVADVPNFVSDALGRDIGAREHSRRGRTKTGRKG